MIETNPIFLISGIATSALIAPAHAIVVWSRARLVMPGTVSFVTCWAVARPPNETVSNPAATSTRKRIW